MDYVNNLRRISWHSSSTTCNIHDCPSSSQCRLINWKPLCGAAMDARIDIFYRQYLQQVAPEKLSFPPDNVLLEPMVQYQIHRYMFTTEWIFGFDRPSGIYLPPANYQKRVLKQLTRRIEGAIRDPDEDVGRIPLPFSHHNGCSLFPVPLINPH